MIFRNNELAALWAEAIKRMRASGLEPSPMLLSEIEANIRGEMDFEQVLHRVLARDGMPLPAAPLGETKIVEGLARRDTDPSLGASDPGGEVRTGGDFSTAGSASFALLYTSELAPGHDQSCVSDITATARRNNARDGISGVLVFDGHHFAQWLEGPLDELERLLGALRRDPRHLNLRLLHRSTLPGPRLFAGWQLGYVYRDDEDDAVMHLQGLHGRVAVAAFDALLQGADLM